MKKKLLVIMLILMITVTGCSDSKNKESANDKEQVQTNETMAENSNINTNSSNKEEITNVHNEESKINDDNNNDKSDVSEDNNADANRLNSDNSSSINKNTNSSITNSTNTESNNKNISDSELASITIADNETEDTEDSDENTYTLKITGNVSNEMNLSLSDLKAMNNYIFEGDFFSLNSFGTKGYTHFKGVNLWKILDEKSQILSTASKVTVIAHDGYKVEFTIEQVKKQDYIDEQNLETKYPIIIAWEENKEEYDQKEGAPFKLVVGQKEANDVNKPQWVSNIDKIVIEWCEE